jgi:hypothetical protein
MRYRAAKLLPLHRQRAALEALLEHRIDGHIPPASTWPPSATPGPGRQSATRCGPQSSDSKRNDQSVEWMIARQTQIVDWWAANVVNGRPKKTSRDRGYFYSVENAGGLASQICEQIILRAKNRLMRPNLYRGSPPMVAHAPSRAAGHASSAQLCGKLARHVRRNTKRRRCDLFRCRLQVLRKIRIEPDRPVAGALGQFSEGDVDAAGGSCAPPRVASRSPSALTDFRCSY